MNFTPEMNDGKHVFVFGSNLAGMHGAGAALTAKNEWGAVSRIGNGRTGNAYAIPTKDHSLMTRPLDLIESDVAVFTDYAKRHPDLTFLVTGLDEYTEKDIAPMFKDAPENCVIK